MFIEQCKTEAGARWAHEKEALKIQNRELEANLVEERNKAQGAIIELEGWKVKYENLKARLAGLIGDG